MILYEQQNLFSIKWNEITTVHNKMERTGQEVTKPVLQQLSKTMKNLP
jgi:hypothetical protein